MEAPEKLCINIHDKSVEYIRKDTLVKYLYEEKGYPITLNGELVHWDELNKSLAEYNKWKKDAFIEEVMKYLYDNNKGFILTEKDIEDFRKYLENI